MSITNARAAALLHWTSRFLLHEQCDQEVIIQRHANRFMQKTTGPMQQHLGFNEVNVRNINTFGEVRETVSSYLNSKLVVPSMKNGGGPADMDVGALKRETGRKGGKG